MTATIYEKSGHYYFLVQQNEHGKRFRKNCATGLAATAKINEKQKNSAANAGGVGAKNLSKLL